MEVTDIIFSVYSLYFIYLWFISIADYISFNVRIEWSLKLFENGCWRRYLTLRKRMSIYMPRRRRCTPVLDCRKQHHAPTALPRPKHVESHFKIK